MDIHAHVHLDILYRLYRAVISLEEIARCRTAICYTLHHLHFHGQRLIGRANSGRADVDSQSDTSRFSNVVRQEPDDSC